MLHSSHLQIVLLGLAIYTLLSIGGGVGCTATQSMAAQSNAYSELPSIVNLQSQHITDTLYLSDYGQKVTHAGPDGGSTVVLPSLLILRNTQFDQPVYAGRPGERVLGTHIDMSYSTFGNVLDLQDLHLSDDLLLSATTCTKSVTLDRVQVQGTLDLSHARLAENLSVNNANLGALQARKLVVAGQANLQRLGVTRLLSFIEAEVHGYFDGSYLRCQGDSYFDHCKNFDRVVLDHSDFYARLSFANTAWPSASMRHVRARGQVDGLQKMIFVEDGREGLIKDFVQASE